jgi:signal peptide peptidase SppA
MSHYPKAETGCRPSQLFGVWLMDPATLEGYRTQLINVDFSKLAAEAKEAEEQTSELRRIEAAGMDSGEPGAPNAQKPYLMTEGGLVVISIAGPTTKYPTSAQKMAGGTGTVKVRHLLRQASRDPDVRGCMLHIEDCPGGTVAGAYELRDEITRFASLKPIRAHVSDLGASAGYLFASAAPKVTANKTASVGSIGTRAALIDRSKQFEREGIEVHPIAEGDFKAAGLPGTKITPEIIAEARHHIKGLNDEFIAHVSTARNLTPEQVRGFQARVYLASEAKANGLIDGVCSFEEAVRDMRASLANPTNQPSGSGQTRAPGVTTTQGGASTQSGKDVMNLDQLRLALGNPNLTEEQSATAVATVVNDLRAVRAANPTIEPSLLLGHLELAVKRIDLAVDAKRLPAVVANNLKADLGFVSGDNPTHRPNALLLTPRADLKGRSPADYVLAQFEAAHAAGAAPDKGVESAPFQPAFRTIPGKQDSEEKAAAESGDKAYANFNRTTYAAAPGGGGGNGNGHK